MKKKNKILAGLVLTGVLATSGIFFGCGGDKGGNDPLANTSDVYGFAGVTTSMLMANDNVNGVMVSALSTENPFDEIKAQLQTAITETMDSYMNLFDSVAGGEKPVNVVNEKLEDQEYSHKLTVSASMIDGQTTKCVIYFNETLKNETDKEVDDTDDEDQETVLVGKMYLNDSETALYVKGVKEIDADGEVEVEFKAYATSDYDDNNVVIFKQGHEVEGGETEEEYSIKVVVGGITVHEFKFSLERDVNGKIEVEYEQTVNGQTIEFEVERESDKSLKIEAKNFLGHEIEVEVKVKSEVEGKYYYQYTITKIDDKDVTLYEMTFSGTTRDLAQQA